MTESLTSNELFVQARDLLCKIAGETDPARMEVNAWEAMELSRKMRASEPPSDVVRTRAFWSRSRKTLVSAYVTASDITLMDDNGHIYEPAGDEQIHGLLQIAERSAQPPSDAARDVLAERERQKSVEGWTPEHDDTHNAGELAEAAACYALNTYGSAPEGVFDRIWPWSLKWWKPKNRRRDLVRAAALLLADIERIDRAAVTKVDDQ